MASSAATIPAEPPRVSISAHGQPLSPTNSSGHNSSASEDDAVQNKQRLARPKLGSRKSSGTMIISRNSATVIESDTEYDEDDVRTMSPRRNSAEVIRLGEEARQSLKEQAKVLQMSLQDIVDKMELVKSEQEKLEAGNKFLQSYIGELMQTSKITTAVPSRTKAKGRSGK